jgi:hypothetical protein
MRRVSALGTLAMAAAASVIAAASPVGTAAPSSCNIDTANCLGYLWSGPTSQHAPGNTTFTGAVIQFVSDLTKTWVADFQSSIANEQCTYYPSTKVPVQLFSGTPRTRVRGGRFSQTATTQPKGVPAPGVTWHLTGTLNGKGASGTVSWVFFGPNKDNCAPTSGRFTWKATNRGKIGNA